MLLSHLPVLSTASGSPPRGKKGLERGALGFCGVLGKGGGCCVVSFSFRGMKEANPPWSQAACRCWFSPVPRRGPSRGGPRGRSRAARPLPLGCVREQWFQAAWGGSCVLCVLLLGHSPLCFSAVPRFQQLLVLVVCFGCGFFCFLFFFKNFLPHTPVWN